MRSVESVHICSSLFLLKLHAWMYNTQQIVYHWCDLTLAQWFWGTKMCLWASKISKIHLFGRPTGWATSWKANFENYSRYLLIKCINSYQCNTALAILLYSFNFFHIFYSFVSIFLWQNIFLSSFSASISYNILIFFKKVSMGVLMKGVLISVILCIFLLLFIWF